MAFVAGPDGQVDVEVTVSAEQAAKDLEDAFTNAIARAMKDPAIRTAVVQMVRGILQELGKIPKATNKSFQDATRQSKRATKSMADDFNKVGKAAREATNPPSTRNRAFNVLSEQIAAMTANMEAFLQVTKEQRKALELLEKSAAAATRSQDQQNRDAILAANQATRAQITASQKEAAIIRQTGQARTASIREFGRITTQVMRSLTRVFELTWKSAERAVRGFVRIASTVLRGLARVVSSTFQAINRTISAFGRTASRVFTTLGRGVGNAMRGISRAIQSALRRDENAFRQSFRRRERDQINSLGRQARAQQRFQERQRTGLLGGLGAGGLAGVGAGAGIISLLTSGFERAGQEEQLQLTFQTLLRDGDKAAAVLEEISGFARTTSFDFVEVAGSVAQLTAALGDVDRAFELTKNLADVVAVTGGTTEQLGQARLAFSQIAGSGRLMAQDLNQLVNALPGIPFMQIIADAFFAGDTEAAGAARDAGELGGLITADAFFEAFETGVQERFPEVEGFAQVAAGTLTGLTANLRENFAIFGAVIIRLFEGPIKSFIGGVNEALNSLGNFITGVRTGDIITEVAPGVNTITEGLVPLTGALADLREVLAGAAKSIGLFLAAAAGFKIIQLAVTALTSPLGLLVLGFGAIGAIITRFRQVSRPFAQTFEVMTNQVAPLGRAFLQLGRSIRNFFSGTGIGGGRVSIITKIGDAFRWVNVWVARVLVGLREFINVVALGFETGDFAGILGYITGGDNRLLSRLEDTFLGPIVRWFRGPFINGIRSAISGVSGLIGDIFGIIFGGGDTGAGGAQAGGLTAIEERIFGTEADQESVGTRILNRLEETFLGPVVRFFRGPVADLIERVGGGIADFGNFLGDLFDAIFGEGGGGIGTRIADVLEDTFAGPVVRFFRGRFADVVETVAGVVVDVFQTVVDGIQSFLSLIEPFTDAVGHFFASLVGAGEGGSLGEIWEGLKESLGNIGERVGEILGPIFDAVVGWFQDTFTLENLGKIGEALDPIWDAITGWFSDTFTPQNFASVGLDILNVLNEIGRIIGTVATSPEFVAGVLIGAAAIAGTIAVVLGSLIAGALEGLADNADDWAQIIVGAIVAALEALVNLIPGIDVDLQGLGDTIAGAIGGTIAGVVDNPIFKIIIATFAIAKFAPTVMRLLGAGFAALPGTGSTNIGTKIADRLQTDLSKNTTVRRFRNIGLAVAGAVVAGVVAYEIGQAAGESGSTGGLILGLLTGTATGAAVGTAIAPGIGTAIGAVLGGAITGLGALFGGQAREAENAREKVQGYADALRDLSDASLPEGIEDVLRQSLIDAGTEAFDAWGDALVNMAEFDLSAFAERLAAGISTPAEEGTRFLQGLQDEINNLDDLGLSGAQFSDFIALVDDLGLTLEQIADIGGGAGGQAILDLGITPEQVALIQRGSELLGQLGITEGDLSNIHGTLTGETEAVAKALELLGLEIEFTGDQATDAAGKIDTVEGAVSALNDSLAGGVTVGEIRDILSQTALGSEDRMKALEDATNNVRDAANEARDAVLEVLLGGTFAETTEDITRRVRLQFAGLGGQLAEEMSSDELAEAIHGIEGDIQRALSDAVSGGLITDEASFDDFIAGLRAGLGDVPEEIRPDIEALIDAIEAAGGTVDWTTIANADAAVAAFEAAGAQAAATFTEGFNASIEQGVRPLLEGQAPQGGDAGGIGVTLTGQIGDAITANRSVILDAITGATSTALTDAKTDPNLTTGAPAVGEALSTKIGTGITDNQGSVIEGALTVTNAAILTAAAGSGGMYNAGQSIGQGLASGIRSMALAVSLAAAVIAQGAIKAARSVLQSRSPSRVFANIGRDVGRGFIQGIKDAEGDMVEALSAALENVITKAAARAGAAVRRAEVGQTIFDLLAPSALPGGTTSASLGASRADLTTLIRGLGEEFRSGAAGSFVNPATQGFFDARVEMQDFLLDFRLGLADTRDTVNEALSAQRDLAKFDAARALLERRRASGSLGWEALTDQLKELKSQLATGAISADQYAKKAAILAKEYKSGQLNAEAYAEAIKELGTRPAALTFTQQNLIASGATSLNLGTIAGQANAATIGEALAKIQEFAQAAIEAGQPINGVINSVKTYVAQLRAQAVAAGLSSAAIDKLIAGYGLSTSALDRFRANLVSLNINTAAGAANVATINSALQSIRDYGSELIAAGISTNTVVTQLRSYRDQLIAQARAFGFNAAQIAALVTQAGLSNKQLAAFVAQLAAFDREARNAAAVAQAAAQAAKEKAAREAAEAAAAKETPGVSQGAIDRPLVENMNIHLPSGDPEANALAVLNRLAYG